MADSAPRSIAVALAADHLVTARCWPAQWRARGFVAGCNKMQRHATMQRTATQSIRGVFWRAGVCVGACNATHWALSRVGPGWPRLACNAMQSIGKCATAGVCVEGCNATHFERASRWWVCRGCNPMNVGKRVGGRRVCVGACNATHPGAAPGRVCITGRRKATHLSGPGGPGIAAASGRCNERPGRPRSPEIVRKGRRCGFDRSNYPDLCYGVTGAPGRAYHFTQGGCR
jgi:hypothetical protein